MSQRASRYQEEADSVIRKFKDDEPLINEEYDSHSSPYRVESAGETNHWKFPDGYTLDVDPKKRKEK